MYAFALGGGKDCISKPTSIHTHKYVGMQPYIYMQAHVCTHTLITKQNWIVLQEKVFFPCSVDWQLVLSLTLEVDFGAI